ncbi:MAG: DMT family transporter [Planctomycetaceae bacterium]|nr:DMT family transporter [Planctomycetaceae bacterium]
MPYVLFALICAVWGSSFILMKKAVVCFSPVSVGFGRVLGGAAVLLGLWCWRSQTVAWKWSDAAPLFLVVVCGFAWPFSIQPRLVAQHGSAFVGMTVSFTPLLTIVASVPLLGIYPTPRQLTGVVGALICLGLLMLDGSNRQIPLRDLLLAMTVPLSYAVTNTVVRRSLRHVPPLELTLASLAAACAILLPLVVATAGPVGRSSAELWLGWLSLAVLGVVGTGLTTVLFNKLIHDEGPLFAGMVTNLVPVGALLWAWIDHEPVTSLQLAALAGLVAMVTLVQYGAARRPTTSSP